MCRMNKLIGPSVLQGPRAPPPHAHIQYLLCFYPCPCLSFSDPSISSGLPAMVSEQVLAGLVLRHLTAESLESSPVRSLMDLGRTMGEPALCRGQAQLPRMKDVPACWPGEAPRTSFPPIGASKRSRDTAKCLL